MAMRRVDPSVVSTNSVLDHRYIISRVNKIRGSLDNIYG